MAKKCCEAELQAWAAKKTSLDTAKRVLKASKIKLDEILTKKEEAIAMLVMAQESLSGTMTSQKAVSASKSIDAYNKIIADLVTEATTLFGQTNKSAAKLPKLKTEEAALRKKYEECAKLPCEEVTEIEVESSIFPKTFVLTPVDQYGNPISKPAPPLAVEASKEPLEEEAGSEEQSTEATEE